MAGLLAKAIELGSYRPGPRLPVEIEKPSGGTRTLWIPNFSDRVVARILLETVQPLVNVQFFESSFGFRPEMGTWHMLATLKAYAEYHNNWVIVNSDIRKAFDSVQIKCIMKAFEELFVTSELTESDQDTRHGLLQFIEDTLQGGDAKRMVGISTGCPFSPLALNVLLHQKHDALFNQEPTKPLWIRRCENHRYADNLVHLVKSVLHGRRVLGYIRRRLQQCKLPLKEGAEVVDLRNDGDSLEILGFIVRHQEGSMEFELPPEAIQRFSKQLVEAYEEPRPALTARQMAQGWVSSMGPASDGWHLLPQIARALATHGFRDVCSTAELEDWWANSYHRWHGLYSTVINDRRLLPRDIWNL